MTLEQIKEKFGTISGDWNGEDSRFTSGGITYADDAAVLAKDILDAVDNLEDLLEQFTF